MYKVKRAIIMAAGIGKRMQPITLEIPKPLVTVNGIRMIDTVIEGLHENGIYEIYVVVGYMKEKFECLLKKYSEIVLIENPYYASCNNISSLYVAREYLSDVIILDGDQIIYNKNVLSPEFERSGYNAVWTESKSNEWLLNVKENLVISCSREGGEKGWQLFSVSRWNHDDGQKLKNHLEIEFEEKGNHQIYWDDIALFCYPKEYELGIRKMQFGDIVEVDSFEELIKLDESYMGEQEE